MQHGVRSSKQDERGFTLIELLVVIIILGILSAVVVFAVRGTNDKGKAAAVSTDEKTIRTAEEAYCANKGEYGSGDQLVAAGFLSEVPKYHQVSAQKADGSCNGWRFFINRTDQAGAYPPGRWDLVAPSNIEYVTSLVRLPDGKVFAVGFGANSASVWNPVMNEWTAQDPIPPGVNQFNGSVDGNTMILLTDDPGTPQKNECKDTTVRPPVDNCGKVLVLGIALFDPRIAPGKVAPEKTQWEVLPTVAGCNVCTRETSGFFTFVQLKTKIGSCGMACGKIYIWSANPNGPANGDVYDPSNNTYTPIPLDNDFSTSAAGVSYDAGINFASHLSDGRIFLCCNADGVPGSAFLNPQNLQYSPGPVPPIKSIRDADGPAPVLPNGDLFYGRAFNTPLGPSVTYRPEAGGPGTFGTPLPCSSTSPLQCRTVGSLPDGRVLGIRSSANDATSSNHQAFVYNPATGKRDPTSRLNLRNSFHYASLFLDPSAGPCGSYCGKMLVAGENTAEVYTP